MSDFNLDNAVPSSTQDGQEVRRAPFSLDNALPNETVLQMLGRNAAEAGKETMNDIGKVAAVIRWPLDRFIWYPIGKAGEYMQGGDASGQEKPVPPSGKEFLNTPLAPLGRIWNNYYRSTFNGKNAPDWYVQMASFGSIGGIEPGIMSSVERTAENLSTRVATPEEANAIRGAFQPVKDSLNRMGVKPEDLHAEGNVVSLSNDSELYLNKHVSAVIRGDEIRIPRWMKINTQDSPAPIDVQALPNNYADNMPLTNKNIIPTPPKGPDLTSESGQLTIPPVEEFIQKSVETLPTSKEWEKGFTQLKTQAQADDLRARQLLGKVNITPADAEALYHHQENPAEPLNENQQKIYNEVIKPLADKNHELFAKLRNQGVPVPSEGVAQRIENTDNVTVEGENVDLPTFKNTEEAASFGQANAKNPKILAALKQKYAEGKAEIKNIQDLGDKATDEQMSEAFTMAQKNQLWREAYESATKTGGFKGESETPSEEGVQYTPRFVEGKGNVFDRLKADLQSQGGTSGLLRKTSPSFKSRVMKILTDEKGNRQVVSIKGGHVVGWTNKDSSDLGNINSATNEQLLDKETEPIYTKIHALEKEEKTLMATKGRKEASVVRLRNIQDELMHLQQQANEIAWKYNPENLDNKVFVDKNGKKWTVGEATTREIEQNSKVTYHKNALLNNLVRYNELRKVDRATQWLESIKNSPEFQRYSIKEGMGNPPVEWKKTSLPQFRGYYFEPRIADTFDYFNKQLYKTRDPIAVLTSINRFLRSSIFFNPLIHIPNIATHWATLRGVSGLSPTTYARFGKTYMRAFEAVTKQNGDYLEMLEKGVNLMYHDVSGQKLNDLMMDKMGQQLRSDQMLLGKMQKILGNFNPYNFSSKLTWAANDIATMQSIYEEMEKGKSMSEAIEEVAKHIPNYVVPSRVLNERWISEIMTNPNITMFGAYHYGALKAYGELAKSLLGKVPLKERAEALDKLAMIGLMLFAFSPLIDKVLKKITGDPNAHIRRPGSLTLPENLMKLKDGKIDFAQLLQSVMTPSVGAKELVQLGFNRNLFTGEKIINRGMVMEGLKDLAVDSVAPLTAVSRITDGKVSLKNYLYSLAGVSFSDPNKSKLIGLKDSKAAFQKEFDKDYLKNPEAALKEAKSFNDGQMKDLVDVVKDENVKEIPRSIVNEFIVTSTGTSSTKSVEQMLSKTGKPKRQKFSILEEQP